MSNNFSFKPSVNNVEYGEPETRVWTRDNRDNKFFKELQIKDLSPYVDENTVFVWDFDGVIWKEASKAEDSYIIAKNLETEEEVEHKNITAFKGRTKKGFGANSWISLENIKREANGLEPYNLEDFEITKHKRLKKGCSLDTVKESIQGYIDDVKQQWGIKNILLCIGEGKTFRDRLPLAVPYKGQRDPNRPLLLKEARQWVLEELKAEMAPEGFENDDVCEWYSNIGWNSYKKTKKFSHVLLAEDKDGWSNPKIYITYTREGNRFKMPQAILIEDVVSNVGTLELVPMTNDTKLVGSGLKWLVQQAFCVGDGADFYHPYLKLPDCYKKEITYGQTQAYKDFVNLNTAQEVLQKAVDNFTLWFKDGVKYTDCHGVDQDFDTLEYMEVLFSVAYMTRSAEDKTTLKTLLDYFKVNYTKIVGNNKPQVKALADETQIRATITSLREKLSIVAKGAKPVKSEKKDLQIARLDDTVVALGEVEEMLEGFYE